MNNISYIATEKLLPNPNQARKSREGGGEGKGGRFGGRPIL